MGQRVDLHNELVSLLGTGNVYFQPPASIKINHPCIIYNISDINSQYADNKTYANKRRYTVMVVDTNPDSVLPEKILNEFEYCSYDKYYSSENLHHNVLTLYY